MEALEAMDTEDTASQAAEPGPVPAAETAAESSIGSRCRTLAESAAFPAEATPDGKRRRRSGVMGWASARATQAGTSTADPAESEADPAADGGSEGGVSPGKLDSSVDEGNRVCVGCQRSSQTGVDWFDQTKPVSWAFNSGRGHWCRECHSLWRTSYSHAHTLHFFGKHIKENERNFAEWEISLVAYLSLMAEQVGRITAAAVTQRVSSLRFATNLLGLSMKPSIFVPAASLSKSSGSVIPKPSKDPKDLAVMMADDGSFRLGMWCPLSWGGIAERFERACDSAEKEWKTDLRASNIHETPERCKGSRGAGEQSSFLQKS